LQLSKLVEQEIRLEEEKMNNVVLENKETETKLLKFKIEAAEYATDTELFQYQERIVQLFAISAKLTQKTKAVYREENKCLLEENQINAELNLLAQVYSNFQIATTSQRYYNLILEIIFIFSLEKI